MLNDTVKDTIVCVCVREIHKEILKAKEDTTELGKSLVSLHSMNLSEGFLTKAAEMRSEMRLEWRASSFLLAERNSEFLSIVIIIILILSLGRKIESKMISV